METLRGFLADGQMQCNPSKHQSLYEDLTPLEESAKRDHYFNVGV